jgi:SAM-dependent methyltransferase
MSFDDATRRQFDAIERNWDERTPIHAASHFYRREAESWFASYEWAELGELTGRDVLHLQCHLGTETAAFVKRGARSVTGLDLSGAAIDEARRVAEDQNLEIDFVRANVYDAVDALDGRQFDVIYTGKGALCYLPDLDRWAATVASLLRPGGIVSIVEFHPMLVALGVVSGSLFADDRSLVLRHDYLAGRGIREIDATWTYTDGPALKRAKTSYEWAHGLGEVVTALVRAGLPIRSLHESDELPWRRWAHMVPASSEGFWRLPDDAPRIPLCYALTASKQG